MGRPRLGPGERAQLSTSPPFLNTAAFLCRPRPPGQAQPEGPDCGHREHSGAGGPRHARPSDGDRDSLARARGAAVSIVRKDGGLGGSEGGVTAAILLTSWLFKEQPQPELGPGLGSLRAQDGGSQGAGGLAQSGQSSHSFMGFICLLLSVIVITIALGKLNLDHLRGANRL